MPGLPDRKIEIVRTLVETAPDKVVGGLRAALAGVSGDSALAGVRRLVEAEVVDRKLRNAVFQPIAPLCVNRDPAISGLVFPPKVLTLIWQALKQEAADEVAAAGKLFAEFQSDIPTPQPFDDLVAIAADGLRSGRIPAYSTAMSLVESGQPGAGQRLLSCLDLSPMARAATLRLPEWIGRMSEERSAAARLAYNDADALVPQGGPCFFEMLAGQLAQRWSILRVISAIMLRPTERYMAASELSNFATRLMDDIDRNLLHVAHFDLDGGAPAGLEAGDRVELITRQIAEIEDGVELAREGEWGRRVHEQKVSLASAVEGRLREIDKALAAALPSQTVRIGRLNKTLPRFSEDLNPRAEARINTLLVFAEAVRTSANYGGFAATRAKVIEKAAETLDHYVEEALALIHEGEVKDSSQAGPFLAVAADCTALVVEPRAGDVVRRRAASAIAAAKAELARVEKAAGRS